MSPNMPPAPDNRATRTVVGVGGGTAAGVIGGYAIFDLIKNVMTNASQGSWPAYLYAITAFCMVALIYIVTAYLALPDTKDGPQSKIFKTIALTFVGAFVGCVMLTVWMIIQSPKVFALNSAVEDYKSYTVNNKEVDLEPDVLTPTAKVTLRDKAQSLPGLTDHALITFSVIGLPALKAKYENLRKDVDVLCNTPNLGGVCDLVRTDSSLNNGGKRLMSDTGG